MAWCAGALRGRWGFVRLPLLWCWSKVPSVPAGHSRTLSSASPSRPRSLHGPGDPRAPCWHRARWTVTQARHRRCRQDPARAHRASWSVPGNKVQARHRHGAAGKPARAPAALPSSAPGRASRHGVAVWSLAGGPRVTSKGSSGHPGPAADSAPKTPPRCEEPQPLAVALAAACPSQAT